MMILLWLLVGVVGRLVIHIPDVTPLTSLALLAPTAFSKRAALFLMAGILVLSDLLLSITAHYPVFGSWTFFSYTGWFAILCVGFLFARKPSFTSSLFYTLFSALFFWVWTDFGTWVATSLYPHTASGLAECFVMALPFLKYSVAGALVWTGVLMVVLKKSPRFASLTDPLLQKG